MNSFFVFSCAFLWQSSIGFGHRDGDSQARRLCYIFLKNYFVLNHFVNPDLWCVAKFAVDNRVVPKKLSILICSHIFLESKYKVSGQISCSLGQVTVPYLH